MYFEVYRDDSPNREWRWRLKAANRKTIANSGEGYNNRQDCVDMINLIATQTGGIPINFLD